MHGMECREQRQRPIDGVESVLSAQMVCKAYVRSVKTSAGGVHISHASVESSGPHVLWQREVYKRGEIHGDRLEDLPKS
jgi:hypothetical protein